MLELAARRADLVPAAQENAGVDSPVLVRQMKEIGQLLFAAVVAADPRAFSVEHGAAGGIDPEVGIDAVDRAAGYHLAVRAQHLTLPWTWLHSGLDFLLARAPLAVGLDRARPPAKNGPAWLDRLQETLFAGLPLGTRPAASRQGAPGFGGTDREILFLAGHCEERVKPLLYREAEAIRDALRTRADATPLARLRMLADPLTPDLLALRGADFPAFHFAGPTARPPAAAVEAPWDALAGALGAAARPGAGEPDPDRAAPDDVPGLAGLTDILPDEPLGDLDFAGVDPITAVLDEVSERSAARRANVPPPSGAAGHGRGPAAATPAPGRVAAATWLLEDGPVQPETLARRGSMPALVFSNSHRSLPQLAPRFLQAGASTFVGPHLALMSAPARDFAAGFYGWLAGGCCAAAALRAAALDCRGRYGKEHPVWLAYGLAGYGSLALQYL